jgi:hypothetical protein
MNHRGAGRLFLFPVSATARAVVERARRAGVRRIVVLSSGAVTAGVDTDFHLPVEDYCGNQGPEAGEVSQALDLPTCERVTDRPGRTFAQWARDHAEDFR